MHETLNIATSRPYRMTDGLFLISPIVDEIGLVCNTYIYITNNGKAILFDPGPARHFQGMYANLLSLIQPSQIVYVVLSHVDEGTSSCLPLLTQAGIKGKIITSRYSAYELQHYQPQSPILYIEDLGMKMNLVGELLQFFPTHYLMSPGAFSSYFSHNATLLSGDLFSSAEGDISAQDNPLPYLDRMALFHQQRVPSSSILRPVMDLFGLYKIKRVLPQHGEPILKDIPIYIDKLRDLDCGNLLTPLRSELLRSGGLLILINELQHAAFGHFDYKEVVDVFRGIPFLKIDSHNQIIGIDFGTNNAPEDAWNAAITEISQQKGVLWLTTLEPYVQKMCADYGLPLPSVFHHTLIEIASQNQRLLEQNAHLDQSVRVVNDRLNKCPVTGLYNEAFLRSLLEEELNSEDWRDIGAIAAIWIDDFGDYQAKYGNEAEDSALNNIAYLLMEEFGRNAVYRLNLASFAVYIGQVEKEVMISRMEKIRLAISGSGLFLGKLTVSVGMAFAKDLRLDAASLQQTAVSYLDLAMRRLRVAKMGGGNRLCYRGTDDVAGNLGRKVLLVDTDATNLSLIKTFLTEGGAEVYTATNGLDALQLAKIHKPTIIVSEIILDRLDGFGLRDMILNDSELKNIETIFLSFKKDEESVNRAIRLGVTNYLKKPYLVSELIGIVNRYLQEASL